MINKYPNVCSDKFKIVALDFDGTVTEEGNFPAVGNCVNYNLLRVLSGLRKDGLIKVIFWSCRQDGEALNNALKMCKDYGLEFDAVNDNIPEVIEKFNSNPRKVVADLYIDDRSLNCDNLNVLKILDILDPIGKSMYKKKKKKR